MGNIGKFNSAFYNPREIEKAMQDPELAKIIRADYSNMRKIANERLARFVGTEWENSKQYKSNAGRYKKLSEISSSKELAHLLTEVQRFTSAKTSTVTGLKQQRNAAIEVLHERGYTFINRHNIKAFGDFMENLRQRKIASLYDSERLADVFHMAEKKGVDPDKLAERFTEYEREQAKTADNNVAQMNRATSAELWEGLKMDDLYSTGRPSRNTRKNTKR